MASKLNVVEGAVASVTADGVGRPADIAKAQGAKLGAKQRQKPMEQKKKAPKAAHGSEPASKSTPSSTSKSKLILKKLRSAKGASIETLMADTGWQPHSVRGFLSAVVKKKLALNLVSQIGKDGDRRYRIEGDAKSA
jgi:hypothetical protein